MSSSSSSITHETSYRTWGETGFKRTAVAKYSLSCTNLLILHGFLRPFRLQGCLKANIRLCCPVRGIETLPTEPPWSRYLSNWLVTMQYPRSLGLQPVSCVVTCTNTQ